MDQVGCVYNYFLTIWNVHLKYAISGRTNPPSSTGIPPLPPSPQTDAKSTPSTLRFKGTSLMMFFVFVFALSLGPFRYAESEMFLLFL